MGLRIFAQSRVSFALQFIDVALQALYLSQHDLLLPFQSCNAPTLRLYSFVKVSNKGSGPIIRGRSLMMLFKTLRDLPAEASVAVLLLGTKMRRVLSAYVSSSGANLVSTSMAETMSYIGATVRIYSSRRA